MTCPVPPPLSSPPGPDAREQVDKELRRIGDRCATLGLSRLTEDVRERLRVVAQGLADLAADASGQPRRQVPLVGPSAAAAQITVTARDAVAADRTLGAAALLTDLRRYLSDA